VVADGEALYRLFVEAGFRAVEIRPSAMTIRWPSLETFVLGHLSGMPVAGAVAALSEKQRGALAREVKTALQSYADGDGVAVPDEINIATAHT
jgi:G:T/U-mismatch repair DNA glycosylase